MCQILSPRLIKYESNCTDILNHECIIKHTTYATVNLPLIHNHVDIIKFVLLMWTWDTNICFMIIKIHICRHISHSNYILKHLTYIGL